MQSLRHRKFLLVLKYLRHHETCEMNFGISNGYSMFRKVVSN